MNNPELVIKEWVKYVKTREKDWDLCRHILIPLDEYREKARNLILWKTDLPLWLNERDLSKKRVSPSLISNQTFFTWTAIINNSNIKIDYNITNVSKEWMQIMYKWNKLKIGDELELTFLLNKWFTLKWEVVWNRNNLYWIKLILPENPVSPIITNYRKYVSLITSKITN